MDYPVLENLDRFFGREEHQYSIAIDPKLLIRALKGLCEKKEPVYLRFGKPLEPIYLDIPSQGELREDKRMLVLPMNIKVKEEGQA